MNSVEALDFAIGKLSGLAQQRSHGADAEPCAAVRPFLSAIEMLASLRDTIEEPDPEPDIDDEPPPDYGPPGTGAVIVEYD